MRCDIQYQWTLTITALVYILTNTLCYCKSTNGKVNNDKIHDKLNGHSNLDITREKSNRNLTAKIYTADKTGNADIPNNGGAEAMSNAQQHVENEEENKWSKFILFGNYEQPTESNADLTDGYIDNKRYRKIMKESYNKDESEWRKHGTDKRKWQILSTWGKRNVDNSFEENSNRDWSQFNLWDKRDRETFFDDVDKRKLELFSSWGKRNNEPLIHVSNKRKLMKLVSRGKKIYELMLSELDKREIKMFTSWLKMSKINTNLEAGKRKWAQFTSWGKRNGKLENVIVKDIPYGRKWDQMAMWGKKDGRTEAAVNKRNRAKLASWGKPPAKPKAWPSLDAWGERRWTGLSTWGKRSGDGFKAESLGPLFLP